jgi:uncharacterized protein (DUF433 family)
MERPELIARVTSDRGVCGGMACIRGTRIPVAVILDSLAEGATHQDILDDFPSLKPEDILAALAYGAELSREGVWRLAAG